MVSIYSTLERSFSHAHAHAHTHTHTATRARASPAPPHRQGLLSTRPFFISKKPPDERKRRRRGEGRGRSRSAEQVSREIRRARCLRRREAAPARLAGAAKFRCLAGHFSPPLECAILRRHGYYRRPRERRESFVDLDRSGRNGRSSVRRYTFDGYSVFWILDTWRATVDARFL